MNSSGSDGGRLLVLTYHYVRDNGGPYPGIHPVTREDFAGQISRLMKRYHAATIEEVQRFVLGEEPLERDAFLITFDDGLVDHFTQAQEVLASFNLQGAFFVPTRPLADGLAPTVHKVHWLRAHMSPAAFVGALKTVLPPEWADLDLSADEARRAAEMHIHDTPDVQRIKFALNFLIPNSVVDQATSAMLASLGVEEAAFCEETFMSASQIRQLRDNGHLIGLHGHAHLPLSSLDNEQMTQDLEQNAAVLGGILGHRPNWLSYPYGRPDALPPDTRKLCTSLQLSAGFSLISGHNTYGDDSSRLKRITPNELDKIAGMS